MDVDAGEVECGAGELVLEARLREAAVAGPAQAAAPNALGDGAFDPSADLVLLFPAVGLLEGAGLLEGLVFVVLPQKRSTNRFSRGFARYGRNASVR